MVCSHDLIEAALDRWSECHWNLHQMEGNYHHPHGFRYALNSFIRAFKEVPQILTMGIQNHPELREATAPSMAALEASDLYRVLTSSRNFLVHRGMLQFESRGCAGTVEGTRTKFSFPFPVHPEETSEEAYERYKEVCKRDKMVRDLLGPDCDSAPAIWRTWIIKAFPGRDLLDVAFDAWCKVGEVLSATLEGAGASALDLSMQCRHDPELVKVRRFSQRDFFLEVDGIDLKEVAQQWRDEKVQRDGVIPRGFTS